MSIDCCMVCSTHVDTDEHPEFYREEYAHDGLCDKCYEARLQEIPCPRCGNMTTIDEGETCAGCKLVLPGIGK